MVLNIESRFNPSGQRRVGACYICSTKRYSRLENAKLPMDYKHRIILSGRHALTRLIVLDEHSNAGPYYTLMKTPLRFWIVHGVSSVKHYIAECSNCALHKAKPFRQLMADFPTCQLAVINHLKFVAWITSDIYAFVKTAPIAKLGIYCLHACVQGASM